MKTARICKLIVMTLSLSLSTAAFARDNAFDKKLKSVDVHTSTGWHCNASADACAAQYRGDGVGGGRFHASDTVCSGASAACGRFVQLTVAAEQPVTESATATLQAKR